MGHPGDYDHPEVLAGMDRILQVCLARGIAFGTTASSPKAGKRWIEKGCRYFEMETEVELIGHGAAQAVAAYR